MYYYKFEIKITHMLKYVYYVCVNSNVSNQFLVNIELEVVQYILLQHNCGLGILCTHNIYNIAIQY